MTRKLLAALLGFGGSLPFLYLGVSAVLGAIDWSEGDRWLLLFLGAVSVLYGIASLMLIGLAWYRPSPRLHLVPAALGALLVCAWALASLDYGTLSGLEWASVIGLATMAGLVWCSVRVLSRSVAA